MGDRINNMNKMMKNPKQRNMFYLIGILAIGTLVGGLYFATRSTGAATAPSGANITAVPNINTVPGSSTSPDYNKKVQEVNEKNAQQALQNGTSFIPTVTSKNNVSDVSPIDLIEKERAEAKRLKDEQDARDAAELQRKQDEERERLAKMQPAPTPAPVVIAPVVQTPVVQKEVKKDKYGSREDYALITAILGAQKIKASNAEFNFAGKTNNENGNNNANAANTAVNQSQTVAQTTQAQKIPLAKAGSIFNAILETAVNSDEPSPVLAKIVSGPLSGTRLIGSVQTVGEKVVLQFSTANMPNQPSSVKISAVAVDPNSSRSALADDVDHHYIAKYGVLLASSFLSGWSQAIARQNTTTTVSDTGSVIVSQGQLSSKDINKQAIGNVGTELSNSVRQSSQNIKPTITVNSGIAIGILLTDDLIIK